MASCYDRDAWTAVSTHIRRSCCNANAVSRMRIRHAARTIISSCTTQTVNMNRAYDRINKEQSCHMCDTTRYLHAHVKFGGQVGGHSIQPDCPAGP